MQALCTEFEGALDAVGAWAERLARERVGPVSRQIQQAAKQISAVRSREGGAPAEGLAEMERMRRLEAKAIESLEAAVRDKSGDRLSSLLGRRQQLAACVATLEQLDEAHAAQVEKLRSKLAAAEEQYGRKLAAEAEGHRREVAAARRRLHEAERAVGEIEGEIAGFRQAHMGEVLAVSQSRDLFRMDLQALSAAPEPPREKAAESLQLQVQLQKLRDDLADYEGVLEDERKQNERLKREVARLRHEERAAKQRAALNL
jgi:chromosome segregation ATPase